jgi:hypothetical protein
VTGIFEFINSTVVDIYCYGLELVAAWIDTDITMEFRYIIRMMGFVLELEFVEIRICGVGNFGGNLKVGMLFGYHGGFI